MDDNRIFFLVGNEVCKGFNIVWYVVIFNMCFSGRKDCKRYVNILDVDMEKEELKRMLRFSSWEV